MRNIGSNTLDNKPVYSCIECADEFVDKKPKQLSKVTLKIPDLHACSISELEFAKRVIQKEIDRRGLNG